MLYSECKRIYANQCVLRRIIGIWENSFEVISSFEIIIIINISVSDVIRNSIVMTRHTSRAPYLDFRFPLNNKWIQVRFLLIRGPHFQLNWIFICCLFGTVCDSNHMTINMYVFPTNWIILLNRRLERIFETFFHSNAFKYRFQHASVYPFLS